MNILGISAFYHDSAACLVRDGEIIAAAQEERFTRKKHDESFPKQAVEYCLREGGIDASQLDFVTFYEKPILKFDRLLHSQLAYAPGGFRAFCKALPVWLRQKLYLPREIDRGLRGKYRGRYVFPEHHESHAASAFFPSPFDEAAILTMDGVGEWATTTLGVGRGNQIELSHELRFPHSLGLLYSAFTYYTGFKVNSGEYKLMGLAPYGKPVYRDLILQKLMDLKPDGSFRMNMKYFGYGDGLTMTNARFDALFGGPPRRPESPITERDMNLAASIQAVADEIVLRTAKHIARETRMKKLAMAGGVALNCVANGRILSEGIFEDVWIQPAAGDAGGSLGAALFVWFQLLENERKADGRNDFQKGSLLGPKFSANEVREFLNSEDAKYEEFENEARLIDRTAELITSEKVVGLFHGRMEFGPRALGARSIVGDPRSSKMQSVMNLKTKFRESFRPFAPSVLASHSLEWFDLPRGIESPYMLLIANVAAEKMLVAKGGVKGLDRLGEIRSAIPAVTHVDGSARVQTVDAARSPHYHKLIEKFRERTGCPLIINTSFNVRGEPIVCTPQDAYRCFMATNMDALVIENFLLLKENQPAAKQHAVDAYLAANELD